MKRDGRQTLEDVVELPKREEAKPKSIPIGTGSPKPLGPSRKVA